MIQVRNMKIPFGVNPRRGRHTRASSHPNTCPRIQITCLDDSELIELQPRDLPPVFPPLTDLRDVRDEQASRLARFRRGGQLVPSFPESAVTLGIQSQDDESACLDLCVDLCSSCPSSNSLTSTSEELRLSSPIGVRGREPTEPRPVPLTVRSVSYGQPDGSVTLEPSDMSGAMSTWFC